MKNQSSNNKRLRAVRTVVAALAVIGLCSAMPAVAQDVRGLEVCTAEKQMDRRTSCLQANTEFLQTAMERSARDARMKLDAAGKELASARNTCCHQLSAAFGVSSSGFCRSSRVSSPAGLSAGTV